MQTCKLVTEIITTLHNLILCLLQSSNRHTDLINLALSMPWERNTHRSQRCFNDLTFDPLFADSAP